MAVLPNIGTIEGVQDLLVLLNINPQTPLLEKCRNLASVCIASIYREVGVTLPAVKADNPDLWELADNLAVAEYQRLIAQSEEAHRVARRNIEHAIEQIKWLLGIEEGGLDTMEVTTPNAYFPDHLEDIL